MQPCTYLGAQWIGAASAVGRAALELEEEAAAEGSAEGRKSKGGPAGHILAPLSSRERQSWRDRIGGSWKWSEVHTQARSLLKSSPI